MDPNGCAEFSYCGMAFDSDKHGGGKLNSQCDGPVTCPECISTIKRYRRDMKTIRIPSAEALRARQEEGS